MDLGSPRRHILVMSVRVFPEGLEKRRATMKVGRTNQWASALTRIKQNKTTTAATKIMEKVI